MLKWSEYMARYKAEQKLNKLKTIFYVALIVGAFFMPHPQVMHVSAVHPGDIITFEKDGVLRDAFCSEDEWLEADDNVVVFTNHNGEIVFYIDRNF